MNDQPTISVDANGVASAAPDVARVRLSTFAEDPAPGDALTSCSLLTARVLEALRDAGVGDSDLQTTSIDLIHYRNKETEAPTYRATSSLTATVRPPADAGRLVAAAVDAAGTGVQINGVGFDIDDPSPLRSAARRDAVAQAVSAARELADAAGLVLGRLVELVEGGARRPPGASGALVMSARAASGAPPVEAGGLAVTVCVTAVFEVEPPAIA
jgi:uncharacterized protein YggE